MLFRSSSLLRKLAVHVHGPSFRKSEETGSFKEGEVARRSLRMVFPCPFNQLSMIVAALFEPIIQRSVGPFPKLAFKAALATEPGKITCPRSGNDRPSRLDLAVLDDF